MSNTQTNAAALKPDATSPHCKLSAPALLMLAGFAVTAGNLCGSMDWGACIPAALAFYFAAIVLAILGLARSKFADAAVKPAPADLLKRFRLILIVAAVVHIVAALAICRWAPGDDTDTYTFQRDAAQSLVHGTDPYGQSRADPYNPIDSAAFYGPGIVVNGRVMVGLQYPPLTALWILPGYLLGDVRYSYILAIVLAALLLFAANPDKRSFALAIFLLFNPMAFYMEDRCFTEPLALLMLTFVVYAAMRHPRWLPVALGLFLVSKQYNLIAFPLIALLITPFQWKAYVKLCAEALAVAALTIIPFAAWNPHALWRDTVLFHLHQPFRQDAMSFAIQLPILLKLGPLTLLGFLAWAVRRAPAPANFVAAYGTAVLLFFSTSKQAFANYYFMIAQALLLAAAVFISPELNLEARKAGRNPYRMMEATPA